MEANRGTHITLQGSIKDGRYPSRCDLGFTLLFPAWTHVSRQAISCGNEQYSLGQSDEGPLTAWLSHGFVKTYAIISGCLLTPEVIDRIPLVTMRAMATK